MKRFNYIIAVAFLFSAVGCADLETENLNSPATEAVLGNPQDWEGVIASQFFQIWHGTQFYNSGISMAMGTAGDAITSSWGNFGMQDISSEPRIAINNTQTYRYKVYLEYPYYRFFSVAGGVNDVMRLINENPGVKITDANGKEITQKLIAASKFMQAYAYGYLALTYDKAQYVDEATDLSDPTALPFDDYKTLMDKVITKLDEAISVAGAAPDFTLGYWNGLNLTKAEFIRLMRTFQARFLVYNARTDAENQSTDWAKVLSLADQGIQADFSPVGDGSWWDAYKYYGGQDGWCRVDYRIISAMAKNTPSRFPTNNSHPLPIPEPIDQRLVTDMRYLTAIPHRADRGLYHFSHYDYTRYDYHYPGGIGAMPFILKAENDLLIAEALVRTGGNKARAAELINITRVGRGGMAALTGSESNAALLEAIMHERFVELLMTGAGVPFFDRRRLPDDNGTFGPYTGLQPGTPRQFPIPALELSVLGQEPYTFGG